MFECKNLQVLVNTGSSANLSSDEDAKMSDKNSDKNLNKTLLSQVNLNILPGQFHVIMGPNGSGKSTLLKSIAGIGNLQITAEKFTFLNQPLNNLSINQRALAGIFLSFQHPPAIPGLKLAMLIKESVNAKQKELNLPNLTSADILKNLKEYSKNFGFDPNLYKSEVNHMLSGGQQKMSELLQIAMIQPKLVLLDEIDSGLDVDALQKMSNAINKLQSSNRSFILVTHQSKILKYIQSITAVHVIKNGKIAVSGTKELINKIETEGYEWV